MQSNQNLPNVDAGTIIGCLTAISDYNSSPYARKQADKLLLSLQSNTVPFIISLLEIFEQGQSFELSLKALVYFCNVIKRTWLTRRVKEEHSQFNHIKAETRIKVLNYLCAKDKKYLLTLFDILKFIVKSDYPNNLQNFSGFVLKMADDVELNEVSIMAFKGLRQIFYEFGQKKGSLSKKIYEDIFSEVFKKMGEYSVKFKDLIGSSVQSNSLNSYIVKLSKYIDQILIYIMIIAPVQMLDEQLTHQAVRFVLEKLKYLLEIHNKSSEKPLKQLLQKNIKSLIYDLGLLQMSKPLLLAFIIKDYYKILLYLFQNYQLFIKNAVIRYTLIGMRRLIKQFSYYAEEKTYFASVRSKKISANNHQLRTICNQFYMDSINDQIVQQLLNFLIFNPFSKSIKAQAFSLDIEELSGIQKGKQKEIGVEGCVILLIEGLLERFTNLTHNNVAKLIITSIENNFNNLDSISLGNLLSVISLLPLTSKRGQQHILQSIPIIKILQFIYTTNKYKDKFAKIISGWLHTFSNEQLHSLIDVLLEFILNQGTNNIEQSGIQILLGCCHSLNKIITQRSENINLQLIIQQVLPVSLSVFEVIENPEILWPMVMLISNIIIKVQFDTQLIINSINTNKLSSLIANNSATLVEALCDMFKGFLCVIPRNMPAKSVYQLVCLFLNNHLSQMTSVNFEKIFNLWYIAIREYSSNQQCNNLYMDLFSTHFRKNLFRKTATLVYILEQYMLSCLIPTEIQSFVGLAVECYKQAQFLEKDEQEKLKIAALSFQITLITKYNLEQVNSDQMLKLILHDLQFNDTIITPTIKNSIMSILNRYIILYQQPFFHYLAQLYPNIEYFIQLYFKNMEYLTSHTALKINAIALLSLLNTLDTNLISANIQKIMTFIIPQVQNYLATVHQGFKGAFIGKVQNSPSLRFSSNVLSERKEQVRKRDSFDDINVLEVFKSEITSFCIKNNVNLGQIHQIIFEQQGWRIRFVNLLQK